MSIRLRDIEGQRMSSLLEIRTFITGALLHVLLGGRWRGVGHLMVADFGKHGESGFWNEGGLLDFVCCEVSSLQSMVTMSL